MIRTFRHKGLKAFYETGSRAGIVPSHAPKLARQLAKLAASTNPDQMKVPGWSMHRLTGTLAGHYAIAVSGNWRLTFTFEEGDALLVDYQDYH